MSGHVACKHWRPGGKTWGKCAARHYRRPSIGMCLRWCEHYDGPPRGDGDVIAGAIKVASNGKIKPCGGCKKRRRRLNRFRVLTWLRSLFRGETDDSQDLGRHHR